MQRQLNFYSTSFLYLSAILISFFFTVLAVNNRSVINPDGLCYVLSAEHYAQYGLKQAMQFCGQASWPFYSVILSLTAKVTTVSMEHAAFILNGIFDAATIILFAMIIRLLTTNPRIVFLGLLTILCAYGFNNVRDSIVRDHGFWMCYLASLYFLLKYVQKESLYLSAAFCVSILLASLFRIEGLVFFTILPLCLTVLPGKISVRLKRVGLLYLPHIVIFIVTLCTVFLLSDQLKQYTGRLPGTIDKILHSVSLIHTQFQAAKTNILQHVLTIEAARDATLVTTLLLIIWYAVIVMSQFSWLYTALFLLVCRCKLRVANRAQWLVLASYFAVNILITSSFFAMHFFLSKRYVMAQNFILMLFVPFALNYLLDNKKRQHRGILLLVIFAWMVLSNFHLFHQRQDPHYYMKEAGHFAAKFIPASQSFFTNDEFILYYSGRDRANFFNTMNHYTHIAAAPSRLTQFDYIAINTKRPNADKLIAQLNTIKAPLARNFKNYSGEQILIYNLNLKERPLT